MKLRSILVQELAGQPVQRTNRRRHLRNGAVRDRRQHRVERLERARLQDGAIENPPGVAATGDSGKGKIPTRSPDHSGGRFFFGGIISRTRCLRAVSAA